MNHHHLSNNNNQAIQAVAVKILSDIVWPFCFVGLRHLQAASQQTQIPIALSWEPFLLNPQMSLEGQDMEEHLVGKYGPSARQMLRDPNSHLKQMGEAVGIHFNNDRRMVNTIQAHQLVEYVKDKYGNDKANALMEQLYERYFVQAWDISKFETLLQVANDVSISKDDVQRAMVEVPNATILQKDRHVKQNLGVSGVPFFMIYSNVDNEEPTTTFSGAYPVPFIAELLQKAAAAAEEKET